MKIKIHMKVNWRLIKVMFLINSKVLHKSECFLTQK